MDLKLILAALRAALAAEPEAAKEAIAKLVGELEGMVGGNDETDAAGEGAAEGVEAEGDPAGGKPEEEEEGKKPALARTRASTKGTETANVDLAVRLAHVEGALESIAVERLITKHADRFTPSVRAWALEQPIAVVASYIKAAGKQELRAPKTAAATRGETQGERVRTAADDEVDASVNRALGVRRPATGKLGLADTPEAGIYRLNSPTGGQIRAQRAQKGA